MNVALKLGEHFIFDLSGCNHDILMDGERAYSLFALRKFGREAEVETKQTLVAV